ncbi:GNAT family N-acetyltransferase [Dongshaea marina]|uniref:GNAT family N-acetyltransferase n=1 Tax=Dongshaea marina TaxID=2047966 RepID=UPI00131F20B4|nr:GNAT family N-acetyltransferase [Dongshaea marina]
MIRQAEIKDAPQLLDLFSTLDSESDFMLYEAGERSTTLEQQQGILENFSRCEEDVMLVCEQEELILGFIVGIGGKANKNRHCTYLAMGVKASHSGQGIGYQLLQALQEWAQQRRCHRIELTVVANNQRAIDLYKRSGFEAEGVKRDALKIRGQFVDEIYMSKLL